jgi:hypothetical protein
MSDELRVVTMLSLLGRIADALESIAGVLSEARDEGCLTVSVDVPELDGDAGEF